MDLEATNSLGVVHVPLERIQLHLANLRVHYAHQAKQHLVRVQQVLRRVIHHVIVRPDSRIAHLINSVITQQRANRVTRLTILIAEISAFTRISKDVPMEKYACT